MRTSEGGDMLQLGLGHEPGVPMQRLIIIINNTDLYHSEQETPAEERLLGCVGERRKVLPSLSAQSYVDSRCLPPWRWSGSMAKAGKNILSRRWMRRFLLATVKESGGQGLRLRLQRVQNHHLAPLEADADGPGGWEWGGKAHVENNRIRVFAGLMPRLMFIEETNTQPRSRVRTAITHATRTA